jgi:hypothetical protein
VKLGSIDAEEPEPLGTAPEGIAIDDMGGWTIDHDRHCGYMPFRP